MKPELLTVGRRALLKRAAVVAMSACASVLLPPETSYAFLFKKKKHKVVSTRLAMGTFVSMTAIHSSRDQAEQAIGLAFAEVTRLSLLLSRHDSRSPVSELNRSGLLTDAPPELLEVIDRSLQIWRQSDGAFDITIKPLLDYYQQVFDRAQEPEPRAIEELLPLIGSEHLHRDGSRLRFSRPGMSATLDGIAKGYIVDSASEILSDHGIADHLINAGGDIRTKGAPAKKVPWKIAIQDPDKKQAYPEIITMASGAIATSGNYEIYYDQERLFHHLIDPKTGRSPQKSVSVTVRAENVMLADALATGVFVLGPVDGLKMIESKPSTAGYVVDGAGNSVRSRSWDSPPFL